MSALTNFHKIRVPVFREACGVVRSQVLRSRISPHLTSSDPRDILAGSGSSVRKNMQP